MVRPEMRNALFGLLLISLILVAALTVPGTVGAATSRRAVILSSLDSLYPMQEAREISRILAQNGYTVTFIKSNAVTVDFITTQLNKYDVIIWRTNTFTWNHSTFWVVGEITNAATRKAYAADIKSGSLTYGTGTFGISVAFFVKYFQKGFFTHTKLMLIESSFASEIAPIFVSAGVSSVIAYMQEVSLSFGLTDYVTEMVMEYLNSGKDVNDAITDLISEFVNAVSRDQLDPVIVPEIWYYGLGTVTLK